MRDLALATCALLAFLLPIGFYCLMLASTNRRSKPLLVRGAWDAVGLLFALAGFFLVTVPMLIAEFYLRAFAVDGSENFFGLWLQQWILWLVYFLFVITGSALMILWRAHKTVIYNVDAELFPKALERVLAQIGLSMTMKKERLILTPASRSNASLESSAFTEAAPKSLTPVNDARYAELEVESFASMCHITLHWENYAPEVRRQVESELEKCLEGTAPVENPAAGWFLNISGMIFGTLMMVVLTFVTLIVMARR